MPTTDMHDDPVEALRDRILTDNVRLHREMAAHYDSIHTHMRNGFEQREQRLDIDFMTSEARRRTAVPRVLELGCGTGNLTMAFLARGCAVTAVDLSSEMVGVLRSKLAGAKIPDERIRLFVADVDSFLRDSPAGEYDIVAMSSVAHHLPDYVATLATLGERIARNGFLYLVHEPAHKDELATGYLWARKLTSVLPRGLSRLSYTWNLWTRAHSEPAWSTQDTTFVDYHEHLSGVSVRDIGTRLRPLGYTVVRRENYNGNYNSLGSQIDNRVLSRLRYEQFQRTYFRVIFQRRET